LNNYYIYVYLDPRKKGLFKYGEFEFEFEPFYVGQGFTKGRWKDLIGRSKYFKRIINKIKESGSEPLVIKLKENLMKKEIDLLEIELIDIIGRKNLNKGPLINFTNGGEGTIGYKYKKEIRELISEKQRKDFCEIECEFKNRCYELLTKKEEYKNAHQKLNYICLNGHESSMCWDKFRANRNCPECTKIFLNKKFKKNFSDIQKEFSERKYKLLSKKEDYKNCYTKLEYKCPNNHIRKMTWSNFHKGRECPDCNKEKKMENE